MSVQVPPSSTSFKNEILISNDLLDLLSCMYNEILIVKPNGEIVFSSQYRLPPLDDFNDQELIKKNIMSMKPQELPSAPVLPLVLENQEQTTYVYESHEGEKVMVVGTPVFSTNHAIERVIIASRDFSKTLQSVDKNELKQKRQLKVNESKNSETRKKPNGVFRSAEMKKVLNQVKKVGEVSTTVLLIGESGVGKEVIAKAIHQLGERASKPFIRVNCGAIPENLLESELFGYKKGAFTGADPRGKIGYFEKANDGIIFLDEISELPLNLQVKLLRVIQERELTPLGGTEPVKLDIQIVTATNKNLEDQVEAKKFREDLYYRLNVVPIPIPPLRERIDDIPYLCDYFMYKFNQRYNKNILIAPDAFDVLKVHPWYGNVRELENFIERLVVTTDEECLDAEKVRNLLPSKKESVKAPIITNIMPLQYALESVEEQLIVKAVDQFKSLKLAAQALEVSQPTMTRKYQKIKERQRQENLPLDRQFKNQILEEKLDKQLRSITSVTASSLNAEEVKELLFDQNCENPVYEKLKNRLTTIRRLEGDLEWAYIFSVTEDNKVINLVADEKLQILPGEYYDGPKEIMNALFEAMKGDIIITSRYTDKFGSWKSSIAPIHDESGKVIAVFGSDFSINYVDTQIKKLRKLLNV